MLKPIQPKGIKALPTLKWLPTVLANGIIHGHYSQKIQGEIVLLSNRPQAGTR